MIEVKEKGKKGKAYDFDIYVDDMPFNREVYYDEESEFYVNDNLVEDFKSEPVLKLLAADFPTNLNLFIPEFEIGEQFFQLFSIKKPKNKFYLSFYTSYHNLERELEWKVRNFYPAIKKELDNFSQIEYDLADNFDDYENNYISIRIYFSEFSDLTINELILQAKNLLQKVLTKTYARLKSKPWKPEYEKNEALFTTDLIIPLLKDSGFKQVKYNHGVKEFGKDIIFTKINQFNQKEYYAVQVKAGNISGSVRGDIDELINQIDDAFKVPINLIGEKTDRYISKLIVAISGSFTENAEIKIRNKVPNVVLGNLIFWDKEEILNLVK